MKKTLWVLLPFSLLLVSCTQSIDYYLTIGIDDATDEFSPNLRTSCVIKQEQESDSIVVEVGVGHYQGFSDDWNQNVFGINPGYGYFAVERTVSDLNGEIISMSFHNLDNFLDDTYNFTTTYISSINSNVNFNYSYKDYLPKLDNLITGKITYTIVLINQNEVLVDNFKGGAYNSVIYFKTKNNKCLFYEFEYELLNTQEVL